MTFSNKILAPSIYLYENAINFSETILNIAIQNVENWDIKNQDATQWKLGDKIVGYDEYPIFFNFLVDESFLVLGKKIFNCASDYATKNLTKIDGFDSCLIRKYASTPGFLELESADVDNASRKLTALLFLNTVSDGGLVAFKNFDVSVAPQEGSILIFPSSFAYSFKINKPKESDSLIVVSHFV